MSKELELKNSIKKFICDLNPKVPANYIKDTTLILEERIINSLQLMDLILFLENISENKISAENLRAGVFASINTIYEEFFLNN